MAVGPAMSGALVLNVTYEPLAVVAVRRAICLVLTDKADLIESEGRQFRSERLVLPEPSVIRLRSLVRVPHRRAVRVSRRGVFARDDYRCQYCGAAADSIDHVVPRSRGGDHVWENIAAACRPCNLSKRDRTPDEAGMHLARPCRAPRVTAWVTIGASRVPDTWWPYLTPIAS